MPIEFRRDKQVIKIVSINFVRLPHDQLPHSLVVQINAAVFGNTTRDPEYFPASSLTRHHQQYIPRNKLVLLRILTSIFLNSRRPEAESTGVIEIPDVH